MQSASQPLLGVDLLDSLELSGQGDLDEQITNWILWDKNSATAKQVADAVVEKDWEALRNRLCNYNDLGTSGLRSEMRAGFDSINDLVTIQMAQGLSHYLQEIHPSVLKRETQGVVIGYDTRYNGKRFAQLFTTVLLNNNFRVYLFSRMVPTPFVSFAVIQLKCLAGVMVTASHNSKTYNGFKIFWSNGAPLLTPNDKNIHAAMMSHQVPQNSSWNLSVLDDHELLMDPYREIYSAYYESMKNYIPVNYLETNECSQLRFIYTPLHGVGFHYIREAFYQARLKPVIPVQLQKDPDPEFPTIAMPSPLEGPDSFNMAIKKAGEEHCTIILSNDADVDRLGVAELDPKGRWKKFSGDELGTLLGWWALESYKIRTNKPNVPNCVMLASLGSSKILASMARIEGFIFAETLVGFKWMSNKALEMISIGKTFLFAYEQCSGYMFSPNVPDKDGISATCQVATMACHLRSTRNLTLIEKLREIYDTYGYHAVINISLAYSNLDLITQLFNDLRSFEDNIPGTYPKCILNGEFEVKYVRDLASGLDTSYPDRKSRLPMSSRQLMTFTFDNSMTFTFRTSSSEPQLKCSAELFGSPEEKNWDEINDTLRRMTDAILAEFIRPSEYGLV